MKIFHVIIIQLAYQDIRMKNSSFSFLKFKHLMYNQTVPVTLRGKKAT